MRNNNYVVKMLVFSWSLTKIGRIHFKIETQYTHTTIIIIMLWQVCVIDVLAGASSEG